MCCATFPFYTGNKMNYYKTELLIKTEKRTRKTFNKEDECVYNAYQLLMYVLQERLKRKNQKIEEQTDNPFDDRIEHPFKETLFKYFETLINELSEKINLDDRQYNLAKNLDNDDFVHRQVCDGNTIIFSLDDRGVRRASQKAIKREEAIAEAKKKQREKEKMLEQAKRLAKAELIREQEELEEQRLEEAEEETNQIVFPLKNYGK